jgi:hypothetical protein
MFSRRTRRADAQIGLGLRKCSTSVEYTNIDRKVVFIDWDQAVGGSLAMGAQTLDNTVVVFRVVEVLPRARFRVWLRYSDGVQGEVDLSHLAGRGVFKAWHSPGAFENVHLAEDGSVSWGSGLDLCADSLYLQLTGKSPEDVFQNLKTSEVDA